MTKAKRQRYDTEEKREANRAYQRDYRAKNPDKARQWRLNYIMRTAARLQAAQAAAEGGAAK